MRHLITFAFLALFIGLLSCSDTAVTPPTIQQIREQVRQAPCATGIADEQAVPIDCYSWGKTAWSGDNPGNDYQAIQGWLQAVALNKNATADSSGLVEVDYIALIELDVASGNELVIDLIDYDFPKPRPLLTNEGGLFSRWYTDNSFAALKNSLVKNGRLSLWPKLQPNKVSHWWMSSEGKYPRYSNKLYYLKARMRITGPVAVQLAADYYKTTASDYPDNREAFHSPWYGDTNGEYQIFCWPELH